MGQVQVLDADIVDQAMTDNGDNTYTYDYTVSRPGEITINVLKYTPNQVRIEYFPTKALTGANEKVSYIPNIDLDWGQGVIYNSVSDY